MQLKHWIIRSGMSLDFSKKCTIIFLVNVKFSLKQYLKQCASMPCSDCFKSTSVLSTFNVLYDLRSFKAQPLLPGTNRITPWLLRPAASDARLKFRQNNIQSGV